jgi:phosphatidylglycerophosphate synthase
LIALGFLIAGRGGELVLPGTVQIGLFLLWISALLTLYTGFDYFKAGLKYVVEE